MRVEDIMSKPVVSTFREYTVEHVKALFERKGIHAAPVSEMDGTISGIVSTEDLLRASSGDVKVEDVMSNRVHIVLPNNRVLDAANMMVKNHVHHLAVMLDGQVVGMLSSMDIVRTYVVENTPA